MRVVDFGDLELREVELGCGVVINAGFLVCIAGGGVVVCRVVMQCGIVM